MKQLSVALKNEPGSLAGVCDALAKSGINIVSLFAEGGNGSGAGSVTLVTADENTAIRVLAEAGYRPVLSEIVTLKLDDRPGEMAKMTRKLARARVNIESVYILNKGVGFTEIALKVDKPLDARVALR